MDAKISYLTQWMLGIFHFTGGSQVETWYTSYIRYLCILCTKIYSRM